MATITARIDDELKVDFNEFCDEIGINASSLINMFLKACVREQKIPMDITAMRADTRDFKYNIEKMHAILKDDSPWENEKDMIKELAVDRRKRYDALRNA